MEKERLLPQTDAERAAGHFRTSGGYTVRVNFNFNAHKDAPKDIDWEIGAGHVDVLRPDKKLVIGQAKLLVHPNSKKVVGNELKVAGDHQRKGLASAMYDAVEIHTKTKMLPYRLNTDAGRSFWESRIGQKYNKDRNSKGYWEPKDHKKLSSFAEFMKEGFADWLRLRRSDTDVGTHHIYTEEDGDSVTLLAHSRHPDGYNKTRGHMDFIKTLGGWEVDQHRADSKEVHDSMISHATRMGIKAKMPEWHDREEGDDGDLIMHNTIKHKAA